MFGARTCAALLSLFLASLAFAASSGPYRGPQNNGVYEASGLMARWPKDGPKLLWKADVGEGFSGVTVADGTVYATGGLSGTLQAYTLEGDLKWKAPFGNCSWSRFGGTRSTPLIRDGIVVCTTPAADVVALDLKTGEQRWKVNAWKSFGLGKGNMGWGYPSTPIVADDKIILNTCSRFDETPPFVAVKFATGEKVWETPAGTEKKNYSAADGSASVFVHNGRRLAVCPTWRSVTCIDPATGARLWEIYHAAGSENTMHPVYSDGYLAFDLAGSLIMGTLNDDGSKFTELWRRPYKSGFAQGVILNKRLYTWGNVADAVKPADAATVAPKPAEGATGSGLLAIDVATGQVLACLPTSGAGHVIAAEGLLYALDFKGVTMRLIAPTEAGMELRGAFTLPMTDVERKMVKELEYQANTNPAIAEGRLFIRYGALWVFDLRPDPPFAGWRGDGQGHYPYVEPVVAWTREKHLRWETAIAGVSLAQPVPAGDRVFVTAAPGTLVCLDIVTGEVLWQRKHGKGGVDDVKGALTTPVVRDGRVYAVLGDGVVVCYAFDGTLVWTSEEKAPVTDMGVRAAVLAGNLLVLQGRSMLALDVATGQARWRQASRAKVAYCPPTSVRVGDAVLLITADGRILRALDGHVLGDMPIISGAGDPIVADGVVYLAGCRTEARDALAIGAYRLAFNGDEAVTVTTVWQHDLPTGFPFWQMLVHDGVLYQFGSDDLTLHATDVRDGKELYVSASLLETCKKLGQDDAITGAAMDVIQAGDHVYVSLGTVVAVFTAGRTLAFERFVSGYGGLSPPAFKGDKQFIRTAHGIMCVGGLGQDPENATWEVNLVGFFSNGRPLNVQLKRQDGKWIAATGSSRTWNKAAHTIDATGLTFENGVLKGTLAITLNPDPWVPADKKPIAIQSTIEAKLKGRVLTGTFTGGVEPSAVTAVTGEILRL